jgi:hypothetical protein
MFIGDFTRESTPFNIVVHRSIYHIPVFGDELP